MTLLEYTLLALSSLFVIVDPIAIVPTFLAMTPNEAPAETGQAQDVAPGQVAFLDAGFPLLLLLG